MRASDAHTALPQRRAVEDEFVIVLSGETALILENSPVILRPGDRPCFQALVSYVHCFHNSSAEPVVLFEISTDRKGDSADYPNFLFLPIKELKNIA